MCLAAVPPESRISWGTPATLDSWRRAGYYTVSQATKSRITVITSAADFGAALLTESENFLDHAAEQQASFWAQVADDTNWTSPAWGAVTLYYWGFFLALGLTRLLGRTPWFIERGAARALVKLAPSQPQDLPGGGSYRVECGAMISGNDREVLLRKTRARIHDDCWEILAEFWADKLNAIPLSERAGEEHRLYSALVKAQGQLGMAWPSLFRNAVNYRPGFGYTAVRRIRRLTGFHALRQPRTYDASELIDRLENAVVALHGSRSVEDAPQPIAEVLTWYVFALRMLGTELHQELVERHGLDSRWRHARRNFLRSTGVVFQEGTWPC